ncbi:MAG TPA: hypothetical protein VFT20_05670, partial [Candidatus Limnocylindrales bacterium]|nr:hypothetical protein [Candidatus Limnocylindrales bacterium]
DARELTSGLIAAGVVPDFRAPDSIRLGLSPLTTSFADVRRGLERIRDRARRSAGLPGPRDATTIERRRRTVRR